MEVVETPLVDRRIPRSTRLACVEQGNVAGQTQRLSRLKKLPVPALDATAGAAPFRRASRTSLGKLTKDWA